MDSSGSSRAASSHCRSLPPHGRRRPRPATFAPLLLLLAITTPAAAHPFLYKGPTCTSHPTTALGRHEPPRPDPATTFQLLSPGGKTVTGVCPGVRYTLSVAFPPGESRKVLLTASLGKLANSTAECPGKEATGEFAPVVRTTWTLPCSVPASMAAAVASAAAAGASLPVELRATSASSPNGAYWQVRASVPLRVGCVTNGCRQARVRIGGGGGVGAAAAAGPGRPPAGL